MNTFDMIYNLALYYKGEEIINFKGNPKAYKHFWLFIGDTSSTYFTREERNRRREQMKAAREMGFVSPLFPYKEGKVDNWEVLENVWRMEYGKQLGKMIWEISNKVGLPELFLEAIWEYSQICENYEDPEVAFLSVSDQESILNFDFSYIIINDEQIRIWVGALEKNFQEKLEIDPEYYLKEKVEEFIDFFKNILPKEERVENNLALFYKGREIINFKGLPRDYREFWNFINSASFYYLHKSTVKKNHEEKYKLAKKLWGTNLGELFPTIQNEEGFEVYINLWDREYGQEMGERIKRISEEIDYPEFFLYVINQYTHVCKNYEDPEVDEMQEKDKRQMLNFDFAYIIKTKEQEEIWKRALEEELKMRVGASSQEEYYMRESIEKFILEFTSIEEEEVKIYGNIE